MSESFLEEQSYDPIFTLNKLPQPKTELLSLPPDGIVGSVDMTEALPSEMKHLYETGDAIFRPRKEWISEIASRPFMGVLQPEYRKLILRLREIGIVETEKCKPTIINGIFVVPKEDGMQRLIIDARNANKAFSPPPNPDLPYPRILADLYLPKGSKLYVAKSDLDNYYHRLCLPMWTAEFFGLPAIWEEGEKVWPVIRSLPMGCSHSALIAQYVHLNVLGQGGLNSPRISAKVDNKFHINEFDYDAYIDDYFSLGTCRRIASEKLKAVIYCAKRSRFPAKESKIENPEKIENCIVTV